MTANMYYITDVSGNYYRVNNCDQLAPVESKDYADLFSLTEANQKIGTGKKSHFYSVVPVEEAHGYKMQGMDWLEYMNQFCYLASGAIGYQENLNNALHDLELQICDILHYIELYDLDEKDSVRITELLKECREQRRDVKDEMLRVECFQKSLGTIANLSKVKENMVPIKKLSNRSYNPRKLATLFEKEMEETVRVNKLDRAMADTNCMDAVACTEEPTNGIYEMPQDVREENTMEYTKQETVFDGQKNNWLDFARQQEAFYANAEQYLVNLQIRQDELQDELEQVLEEVENATYNVTQGYNVYKRLKDLRNEKKRLQKELEALYILTYGVNCNKEAENMAACVKELENLYGGQTGDGEPYEAEIEGQMVMEPVLLEVKIAG